MSQFSSIITSTPSSNKRKRNMGPMSQSSKKSKRPIKKYSLYGSIKQHNFVRTITNDTFTLSMGMGGIGGFSGTGQYNMSASFSLQGVNLYLNGAFVSLLTMPSYTEFTTLYDQFRIDFVETEFLFSANSAEGSSGFRGVLPFLYVVKDYDDTAAITIAAAEQYDNVKLIQLGARQNKFRVKPAAAVQTYNTALTTGYSRKYSPWIDTSTPDVPHYGVKWVYNNFTNASSLQDLGFLYLRFKYHMSMNNVK